MIQAPNPSRFLPEPALVLHALRTALAATLTAALTRLLGLEQGYWAVFSAVLVMQADFGSSLQASWTRLFGTAVGAALGALAATLAETLLGPGASALTLAMFAAIFLCAVLSGRGENFRLAGVTAAIVISLHQGGADAFALGASRFLEVGLGIVVALGVSLAWPSRARVILRVGAAKGLAALAGLTAELMDSRLSGRYDQARVFHSKDQVLRLALKNRQLLAAARREPGQRGEAELLADLLQTLERMAEHLLAMDHAIENAPPEGFHLHLAGELSNLGTGVQAVMLGLADAVREPTARRLEASQPAGFAAAQAGLARTLAAAEDKLLALRPTRVIAGYDLDEVMHFYSFYHGLRETARETLALAARLAG